MAKTPASPTGEFSRAAETLDRLAEHVLRGDVVFFIGSGASLDSEWNSASRLMTPLLVRTLALADVVGEPIGTTIREDLRVTFSLRTAQPAATSKPSAEDLLGCADAKGAQIARLKENLELLAPQYYEANEWFCHTFACLIGHFRGRRSRPGSVSKAVARREGELWGAIARERAIARVAHDGFAPEPICPSLFKLAPAAAAKALFLDTMGFQDPRVMGGCVERGAPFREVARSFEARLLPRHHVMARLAREGLCPTILTTNFDLLLEGACRLAGFREESLPLDLPATQVAGFQTIASPGEFFTQGKGFREALVVKMHGCAHRYRLVSRAASGGGVEAGRQREEYLRSMVFTYREIQNWRQDSWAADFLRTLLRTRVVVFCGYSLRDPVIHDTFRTVYEEMKRVREAAPGAAPAGAAPDPRQAPAFVFSRSREFHSTAVLKAATAAVGAADTGASAHPNHVAFHYRGGDFPNLDELFGWLYHRTVRRRQQDCLEADLRRVSTLLLGRPRPDAELAEVRRAFGEILRAEAPDASWAGAAGRRRHARTCAWTEHFHPGLLREFACADLVRGGREAAPGIGHARRYAWYYPVMQDAGWTCWGAVVEVALRTLIGQEIQAVACPRPTVLVRAELGETPLALTIQVAGFDAPGEDAAVGGHPWRRVRWELCAADAPWPRAEAGLTSPPAVGARRARLSFVPPDAGILWRLAAGTESAAERRAARAKLGFSPP